MINLRIPANGPPWLPAFASSIVASFKAIMAAPFRLWDVATADLPPAADWAHGLIYDATTDTIKYSDGTNWIELKDAGLFVLKAGDRMSGSLIIDKAVPELAWAIAAANVGLIRGVAGGFQYFANAHAFFNAAGTINELTITDTGLTAIGWIKPAAFTVATVPSAATSGAGAMIYVSNETGGAVPAFSDGTNWRRVTDRAVIS